MSEQERRDVDLAPAAEQSSEEDEAQEGNVLEQAELRGRGDFRVDLEQPAMGGEDEQGEDRADDEERGPELDEAENGRRHK